MDREGGRKRGRRVKRGKLGGTELVLPTELVSGRDIVLHGVGWAKGF